MDEKIIEILLRICLLFGAKRLARKLVSDHNEIDDEFIEQFSEFIGKLEKKFSSRLFQFNDRTQQAIILPYIIQFRGDITFDGEPTIVLNDFPLGLKGDKNPVINLVLVYDDYEVRNQDLEDLKFMIS